jgi:hypothetical protein
MLGALACMAGGIALIRPSQGRKGAPMLVNVLIRTV